jgi:RNA polymerase sigma factor (sigma-70 family)
MERRCTIGRMNETATARSGETGALDTWYRAHAQKLFCTVRRITRNHEDAEDAVQDAFLRAFLHLQSFDGRSTFSTWLTRIGINSALMILRKRRNSREVPAQNSDESDALWEITDSVPDPEKQYVEKERAGLVRKAITNLRLSIRRPLQLRKLQGYSLEEMAAEIGVSVPAAKGRLFHARNALRKSKALRKIGNRHPRQQFSNLQHQLQPEKRGNRMKSKSTQSKPSLVFAHGIWADGSCFSKVVAPLQAEGYEVLSSQYSLDTTAADVATIRRTLGRVSSPAILVGHSYGGSVITAAGTDNRVTGLVYIAALAPDAGETSQTQQANFPRTDVFSHIEVADGRIWMLPQGVECFAGDLSEQEKKLVWATHFPPAVDLFDAKVESAAWKSKPTWYIVATRDRTVQPDLQRFFAKRMGATTYEVDSSHVPMLSQPKFVIDVIRTAAQAVGARSTAAS